MASSTTAIDTVRSYANLTKPRLLPMVLLSGLPVLALASGSWPEPMLSLAILLGIALAAASANTLNAYIERDTDALMERTRERPLPSGEMAPAAALSFGLALAIASTVVLYLVQGVAAAGVGVGSILFYVFVYTVWLKPRSAWNAVIGGAAGAAAPLIADVAVNGTIGPAGLTLFAIVFFWQPPHVWAIALYRKDDYAAAGIPMLPHVIGDQRTRRHMLAYTIGLVPVTLAPVVLGMLGSIYFATACVVNVWFISHAVRVLREQTDAAARRMFHVSLGFLFALFAAMMVELFTGLAPGLH